MSAKYIIHTPGPDCEEYSLEEAEPLLRACYSNSLTLAAQNNVATIAFPAISCGIYEYPTNEACRVAVEEASQFLQTPSSIREVILVAYSENEVLQEYQSIFAALRN